MTSVPGTKQSSTSVSLLTGGAATGGEAANDAGSHEVDGTGAGGGVPVVDRSFFDWTSANKHCPNMP